MIVITGAAGFIGSCMVSQLNREGHQDLVLVDDFSVEAKVPNLEGKQYLLQIHRDEFVEWLREHGREVEAIFHIGARTDTAEQDWELFLKLNVEYSKALWQLATKFRIPFLYASSAATYGDGSRGFMDHPEGIPGLEPLNPYGKSKQVFDEWVLGQTETPPRWTGFKFFNVYGPNEYHKGRMASVIFHAFPQVKEKGKLNLFRSHKDEYQNGQQLRDFIYVRDVVEVMSFWLNGNTDSGIYNLGTGQARSFVDLGTAVFDALSVPVDIDFFDIPVDIREAYQYFTEAEMERFWRAGFVHQFRSLEEGAGEYVQEFLSKDQYF